MFQDSLLLNTLNTHSLSVPTETVINCKAGLVNLPRRLWVASNCGMLAESCCLFWAASFAKKGALLSGDLHNQICHRTDTKLWHRSRKYFHPCPGKESYCWPSPRRVDRFEAGIGPRLHFVMHVAWKAFSFECHFVWIHPNIPSHTRWYLAFDQ